MQLIDACIEHQDVDEILALPDVAERVELYRDAVRAVRRAAAAGQPRCDGDVVVVDLRDEEVIHAGNRFMVYALFPEARVSVHVHLGPAEAEHRARCRQVDPRPDLAGRHRRGDAALRRRRAPARPAPARSRTRTPSGSSARSSTRCRPREPFRSEASVLRHMTGREAEPSRPVVCGSWVMPWTPPAGRVPRPTRISTTRPRPPARESVTPVSRQLQACWRRRVTGSCSSPAASSSSGSRRRPAPRRRSVRGPVPAAQHQRPRPPASGQAGDHPAGDRPEPRAALGVARPRAAKAASSGRCAGRAGRAAAVAGVPGRRARRRRGQGERGRRHGRAGLAVGVRRLTR